MESILGSIQFWILLVGTFVVPAVIILGDNEQFSSRKRAELQG